jgi:acetyltransferase-like isoleucine patch superfamily enzyme
MLSGKLFSPNAAQLVDKRDLSSKASFRFNTAVQRASDERMWLFKQLVTAGWIYPRAGERHITGHLGHGVNVSAPFHCDYGYNLSIGDNVILGPGCQLLDSGRIVIGKNTKIGARVTISTLDKPTVSRSLEESERTETAREVCIGENAYISGGCIIKAGVRIGDNMIVRAGSVVVQASVHHCLPLQESRIADHQPLCKRMKRLEDADRACAGYSSKLCRLWQPCKISPGRLGRLSAALPSVQFHPRLVHTHNH